MAVRSFFRFRSIVDAALNPIRDRWEKDKDPLNGIVVEDEYEKILKKESGLSRAMRDKVVERYVLNKSLTTRQDEKERG